MSDHVRLTDGVVRVLGTSGRIAGAGFVVAADGLIATCAHVVEDPEAPVTLVFQATGETRQARVLPAYWRDGDHGDVAFLQVDGTLPDGVRPLALGPSAGMRGHRFRTFGYPAVGPAEGMYGYGQIGDQIGENGSTLLQVSGANEVARGFSGGPVFDETAGRVIGMTSAIMRPDGDERGGDTAFAVPAETLRAVCGRLEVSARCPYRSLDAFTERDAEFFWGRERAVTAVLDGLERDRRFMAVLGPSGCGKSSLVQAGVLPRLRGGALTGSDRWGIIVARPGGDPFGQLGSSGLPLARDLTAAVRQWQAAHPGQRLVLVLDQFEELLVAAAQDVRGAFVTQLPEALQQAQPLTVLLVMRDDFYAPLAESAPELMGWVAQNQVIVPATLAAGELADIVEKPASSVGLRFEAGLVDLIVADAVTASGPHAAKARGTVLPLLEFALTQLWERRADGLLAHHAYHQIGRVTGGLSQWCDRAVEELDGDLQPVAETVVTALVHLGVEADGVPHSRRRRRIAELRAAGEAGGVDKVVAHLTARRLLVTSRQDGQEIVELIHDALIRQWPKLGEWLEEDQAFLVWRQRVEDQAAAWISSAPDESRLLRGQQLAEAEGWSTRHPARLSSQVTGFVGESQRLQGREQERDRLRLRRLRLLSAVLAGVLALALVATAVGVWQSWTAREALDLATARQFASRAAANMDQQPLSLLLSLESLRLTPTDEGRAALLRGVLEPRRNAVALVGHAGGVYGVAFSPDSAMVAAGSADRTVRLWDARTGEPIGRPLTGHDNTVRGVAFSPDGTRARLGQRRRHGAPVERCDGRTDRPAPDRP
ncbi:MAG: trypsin-like peptidase domain-containing protein [Egibacteraceae bacterium]